MLSLLKRNVQRAAKRQPQPGGQTLLHIEFSSTCSAGAAFAQIEQ